MKMIVFPLLSIFYGLAFTAPFTLAGRVVSGGSPVPGAFVSLANKPATAITDSLGRFTLTDDATVSAQLPEARSAIQVAGSKVIFQLAAGSRELSLTAFDSRGRRLGAFQRRPAGGTTVEIPLTAALRGATGTGIYFFQARAGSQQAQFAALASAGRDGLSLQILETGARGLAKAAAVVDTLVVGKFRCLPRKTPIEDYTTPAGDVALTPDTLDLAALGKTGKASLYWGAVTGATGYEVRRATSPQGPFQVQTTVTTTEWTQEQLTNGTTYYYQVAAKNGASERMLSQVASARPIQLPDTSNLWDHTWNTTVANNNGSDVDVFFWHSPHTAVVKGVFIFGEYGLGADLPKYADLRYLANSLDMGILMFRGEEITNKMIADSGRVIWNALGNFATQSSHPELVNVPVTTWGHSNASPFSTQFTASNPSRVIAWISYKSAEGAQFTVPGAYRVPGQVLSGENDKSYYTNQTTTVETIRSSSHALMHMIVEPFGVHYADNPADRPPAYNMNMAFYLEMVKLRLPPNTDTRTGKPLLIPLYENDGWLGKNWSRSPGGKQLLEVAPYATYSQDKNTASWLPNGVYAKKWQTLQNTAQLPRWW